MEKDIKIKIGQKYIYGTLRGSLKNPLIIFVHGLTGQMNEHIFFNGARYFGKKGFSSFRFNLYGSEKDARKLEECNLAIHARDLDFIIDYFWKNGVKKIFIIGHSYGGPTVLLSKKDFQGIVFWDPTHNPKELMSPAKVKPVKSQNVRALNWGFRIIIGQKMINEAKMIDGNQIKRMIARSNIPFKVIAAGQGHLVKQGKKYYSSADNQKSFEVIKRASHCFDEEGAEEELFKKTNNWLKTIK